MYRIRNSKRMYQMFHLVLEHILFLFSRLFQFNGQFDGFNRLVEVVVDNKGGNSFSGIYIIDPRTIEWKLEKRQGVEEWIPYQDQQESWGLHP